MFSCERCGAEHDGSFGSGRFCGLRCSKQQGGMATAEKRKIVPYQSGMKPYKEFVHSTCGQTFIGTRSINEHRKHCKSSLEYEDFKKDRKRKQILLEERCHRCEVCKNTEWMGQPIPLEFDHIDGDPWNHDKTNHRLICPNCHAQTPTHAGRNVGRHQNKQKHAPTRFYPSYRP